MFILTAMGGCASTQGGSSVTRMDTNAGVARMSKDEAKSEKLGLPAEVLISSVADPNRLVTDDGKVIQLAGIIAPIADREKRIGDDYYGKPALDLVRRLTLNKKVHLAYDATTVDSMTGSLIARVTLADGSVLGEQLVRRGMALVHCKGQDVSGCGQLMRAQQAALRKHIGIWNAGAAGSASATEKDDQLAAAVTRIAVVKKVIDGDTVRLTDGTLVRYIAIDAPESYFSYMPGELGNSSMTANQKLVEGKQVVLEYDVEKKDPRGRDLAYVWVKQDNELKMVNEILVEEGYAWVAVFPPDVKYVPQLMAAQESSMKRRAGLWGTGEME